MASINIAVPVARFDDACRDNCLQTLERAVARIRQQLRLPGRPS
jgi:DNA-binding IclR family transcriptional regulator